MKSIYQTLILSSIALLLGGAGVGCGEGVGYNTADRTNNHNHTYRWGGSMQIHEKPVYRRFLKEYARICDLYNIKNWGTANCKHWDDFGYIYMTTQHLRPPVDGSVTVVAYSGFSGFSGFSVSTRPIRGQFYLIDNSRGFEMRTLGPGGTPSYNDLISVVADRGSVLDADDGRILRRIQVRLFYGGSEFASAEVSRQ